ncbi:MAG: hypothetical protein ACJAWC_000088 [Yoonia sp.]|jgi:hypothetical protein
MINWLLPQVGVVFKGWLVICIPLHTEIYHTVYERGKTETWLTKPSHFLDWSFQKFLNRQ